jgi:hypothetical protein
MEAVTLVSSSIADLLRQAGAAGAAERGLVHIISVAPIRDAVGERWARHEPLIEDFVVRSFKRGARDDDVIVRANETDFILIQSGRDRTAALSRASLLMRQTLNYFLGAAKAEHIAIAVVDKLDEAGVEATRVTEPEISRTGPARVDLSKSEDGSPPWEQFGVVREPRQMVTIRRADGTDLKAVFFLDPVWNVARGGVVSFSVETVAVQVEPDGQLSPIEPADMTPRCHVALALRRMQFLRDMAERNEAGGGASVAFHLPVSYDALVHFSTRGMLLAELRRLSIDGLKSRTIIELTEVPSALPHVRLTELIAQIRPFARSIFVRLEPNPADFRAWTKCGAVGLVLPTEMHCAERAQMARVDAFVRQCADIGMVPAFCGVNSRSMVMAAWAAGVTLMSGDFINTHYGEGIEPRRFSPEDLYQAA